MSFHNGVWTDPDDVELERIADSILNPPVEVPQIAALPTNVNEIIDNVVTATVESTKHFINTKVYSQTNNLKNLLGKKVDIIIPVYNAIHLTETCIRTLYNRTDWPFELYVVDDASNQGAKVILQKLQQEFNFNLITNPKNHGFAASVNKGCKAGSNDFIVLLNSDVLVTDSWLTKMLLALEDDKRNQIVNPVTNNTAQISVNMYPGYSYLSMNKALEAYSERRYPEIMPTGFCYMVRRELFKKLGYFSPNFINFGEESSAWMGTITHTEGTQYPHYRAVLADDTYVFHQRSVSFAGLGEDENMKLRNKAAAKFHRQWPQYGQVAKKINCQKELEVLRTPLSADHLNFLVKSKYKICWLVHSVEMCGGMMYIADIVNEINERGGDARVALVKRKAEMAINPIAELRMEPVVFESYQDVLSNFSSKVFNDGVVVASTVELAPVVSQLTNNIKTLSPLLHVQSYEPDLVDDPAIRQTLEAQFNLIPNVIVNSSWVANKLKNEHQIAIIDDIPPGVDSKVFYPRNRKSGDDRPTVMVAVRKNYVFKGYARAVQLIKMVHAIAEKNRLEIRILVYGVEDMPECQEAICLGPLSQVRLAEQLGKEVDVFIDPSNIHSYGLPALEALVSGCTVVSWDNKGINEYVQNNKNGVIFANTTPTDQVAKRIVELLFNSKERERLGKSINTTRTEHGRNASVNRFINSIEKRFGIPDKKKIVVVSPHLRKHGGPTTIIDIANGLKEYGHDVLLATCHSDIELDVIKNTDIPITLFDLANTKLPEMSAILESRIPECDLIISNSDNPLNELFTKTNRAKKKIMLKLSHNALRFKTEEETGLKQNWDAIVTSADWLKDICINPPSDAKFSPIDAEKVFKIGWSHYGHEIMKHPPVDRDYAVLGSRPIIITTLVHQHPSKGTIDGLRVMEALYKVYGKQIQFFGIGEVPKRQLSISLPTFVYNPRFTTRPQSGEPLTRDEMAAVFARTDIWLGASHSEGLGRMGLEAMSASAACVLSDTSPEYVENGKNALMFPVGDLKKAAELCNLLITNVGVRREVSVKGFETAVKAANKRSDVMKELNKAIVHAFR